MQLIFTTTRLMVREYEPDDWKTVHQYARLPDVVQFQNWGPNSPRQTQQFVKDAISYQSMRPRRHYEWCICLEDGEHIGGCGVAITREDARKAQIGYILHPTYWNRGFITEIVASLLVHCQEFMKLQQIGATCDTRNIASQRVLEKNGFLQMEKSENDFMQKGVWRDTFYYEYPWNDEKTNNEKSERSGTSFSI